MGAHLASVEQLVVLGAGFDTRGVSYYLPREVVAATLRDMSRCGKGSVVALDYFSREVVQGTGLAENVLLHKVVTTLGEPFDFGLEMSQPARRHAAEWVGDVGLQRGGCDDAPRERCAVSIQWCPRCIGAMRFRTGEVLASQGDVQVVTAWHCTEHLRSHGELARPCRTLVLTIYC